MVTYTFGHYTQQISVQLRREGYPALLAGNRLKTSAPNEVVQDIADQVVERVNRGLPGVTEWVEHQVGYSNPWVTPATGGRKVPMSAGCP
jgi:hypothetical protein